MLRGGSLASFAAGVVAAQACNAALALFLAAAIARAGWRGDWFAIRSAYRAVRPLRPTRGAGRCDASSTPAEGC